MTRALIALVATPAFAGDKNVSIFNDVSIFNHDDPIPVVVADAATSGSTSAGVAIVDTVDAPRARIVRDLDEVPAGKILVVDHVSIRPDVAVRNRPTTGLRIAANLRGYGPGADGQVDFEFGPMDEFARTSRGTPNFIVSRGVTAHFGAGPVECVAAAHFDGSDLHFALIRRSLAGRLIDGREPGWARLADRPGAAAPGGSAVSWSP